ncbi:DUF5317 domain-containing protein [Alicyclobacillus cycloheptanicus]|uniref:DUF5317 domain-containing protein n=1 Tax=Alicyclobacillus cycloheptanicus TaxID=1457 RepID=A0ABT9XLD2_9BACL|nr:DUF5317 family protein [Alicyclobacillus cycloheptanicus]MDQ0191100.1 hypothetical protein [Alicyclobacillus cycloheptanicus]WDL99820.1 DUF5317 domain-containing protein [Alicyclobacillus cycloheptanicus]
MAFEIGVILCGLIIGWVRKGSLWALTEIRLKWLWVLPISYLLQHISIAYFSGVPYEVAILLSYISLIAFCLVNLKVPGVAWTLLGTCLNFLVMAVNHLRMPAYLPVVRAMDPKIVQPLMHGEIGKSIAMTSATHLNFLGDIFYFEVQPASLISVGDIIFGIGLIILIQHAMRLKRGEGAREAA